MRTGGSQCARLSKITRPAPAGQHFWHGVAARACVALQLRLHIAGSFNLKLAHPRRKRSTAERSDEPQAHLHKIYPVASVLLASQRLIDRPDGWFGVAVADEHMNGGGQVSRRALEVKP